MVVFIDDLDRCISEKTIDILEAIKLFLNVQHSVFVIGADKARIEEGIIGKYGKKIRKLGRRLSGEDCPVSFQLTAFKEGGHCRRIL